MKRILGKIVAVILAVMVMTGLFASCELVVVNVDRDMVQKVAEVKVEGYTEAEAIYKREVMAGYLNYGYYYLQQGTYTPAQVFDMIIDNLTNNRVIVQYAKMKLSNTVEGATSFEAVKDNINLPETTNEYMTGKEEYIKGLLGYVNKLQVAEAVYNTRTSLKSLVDSLDTEAQEETEEVEDETVTPLTTPTAEAVEGEAIDEEYLAANADITVKTVEELDETATANYNEWLLGKYTSYTIAFNTSSQKTAVKEFVDAFVNNGIIFENEFSALAEKNDGSQYVLENYSYYLDVLSGNIESFIIENYENSLEEQAKGKIADAALYEEYKALYETQKATYSKDLAAYETALEGMTKDSFVLYHPVVNNGNYGHVINLLIGFGDASKKALEAWDKANTDATAAGDAAREAFRNKLLASLTAKDQRATWIQNGYYEKDDNNYTWGKDYVKTQKDLTKYAQLTEFNGTFVDNTDYAKKTANFTYWKNGENWVWEDKEEDDFKANFTNIVANEIPFNTFYNNFIADIGATDVANAEYAMEKNVVINDETLQVIYDYLFAYGTDPGSHNTYLGYLYSPKTSAGTYVKEFADAAKYLVTTEVGRYVVVATDFGYHIMICTAIYGKEASTLQYADAAAFTSALSADGDNTAKSFKKAKEDANFEQLVSDIVTYSISKYVDENNENDYAVTVHEKTLKNLMAEVEAA